MMATAAVVLATLVASPAAPAQAFTGADFNAGYIISDANFYDGNAMSEGDIQSFLSGKIAEVGGCSTSNCLAVYRANTGSKPADIRAGGVVVCNGYTAASNESAARIIFKVQQSCGISARVLLVTLQKEQSLLSAKSPTSWQMQAAMGYGCPDSTPGECDAGYYGFFNQVYQAAWQLKRYSVPDYWYFNFRPGSNYIQYNPNPDCGGSWVNIQNNATAALYNYTPYQPNAASLANLYGSGGSCGAHGNRNFWTFYYNWFGNPTGSAPVPTIPNMPASSRIAGADRYETAVEVSQRIPASTGTVFIANGVKFPDALAAAPAAAVAGAPVLLVNGTDIPASVSAELQRLSPTRIVVVGNESSVSADVASQLAAFTPEVVRVGGANRFETARMLTQFFPRERASEAYVVSGLDFADALAAGAAAGSKSAPIILVDGAEGSIDQATADALTTLGVTKVTIAGSDKTVSAGIAASIDALPDVTVNRLGGANRYATAGLIARDAFPTSSTVYLAAGTSFPDALSAAALAATTRSALILTQPTCVRRSTGADITAFGASSVVLLGGTPTLSEGVARYEACD
ncbi:putative cell wall-binding protein [Leifsonia sp. AK011]|uniref:cell wall-binding repeat-containing protein n=1 Tax=Leifsonia sp. AK011 TaxID=2723075 RepID=UPI0015CA99B3|nr:cell wall-binding repeat-containing protein [Leifsonia sp. AK011]NYF11551.1 putative cell wall-binding protein [Leifsonia sp. AK011]